MPAADSTTTVPTVDGVYRIKVSGVDPPLYMQRQPDNTIILAKLDESNPSQRWTITSYVTTSSYRITTAQGNCVLSIKSEGDSAYLFCERVSANAWKLDTSATFSRLVPWVDQYKGFSADRKDSTGQVDLKKKDNNARYQRWVFEHLKDPKPISRPVFHDFQSRFFTLTAQKAKDQGPYDIIIIGSGIGGGVLAADLFETNHKIGRHAKKILVIEKGNLIFHSHCLNGSRPTSGRTGRDQQNDWFFSQFKGIYPGAAENAQGDWKGGPMYALGGRSALWGLAVPRIHDDTLEFFPEEVKDELLNEYYEKAEKLVKLFLPTTMPEHQHLIDRLNITADRNLDVSWEWGRIASEFREKRNFDFAQGAYSTIDKLMEIAMNKPEENGQKVEHPNFKILLGTEARELVWDKTGKKPIAVRVKTADGDIVDVDLKKDTGRVVLSAGSVNSPALLLRSGVDLKSMGGLHVTDHDMIFATQSFRYRNPNDRHNMGSMKFQTYLKLPHGDITLANMSIDSSSFLPRGDPQRDDLPKFIMVYIMRTPLEQESDITLDEDGEPIVNIQRSNFERGKRFKEKLAVMEEFSKGVMKVISEVLKVDFVDQPVLTSEEGTGGDMGTYFGRTKLGGVAHELGSIPMMNINNVGSRYCLDENLKLRNDYENIYVCDLSSLPYSPEVNPTLTLAALSLRLSRTLVPRLLVTASDVDTVYVVNHSGDVIRVWVSRRCGKGSTDELTELGPGDDKGWQRKYGTKEAVFVYKIDQAKSQFSTKAQFLDVPELYVGNPGRVLAVE